MVDGKDIKKRYVVVLDDGKLRFPVTDNIKEAIECETELNPKKEIISVSFCGWKNE